MSVSVLIVNGTGTALTDVNAGGDDIPAYGMGVNGAGTASTMTGAELLTLFATAGVVAIAGSSTQEQRRLASKVLRLGKNPGKATS